MYTISVIGNEFKVFGFIEMRHSTSETVKLSHFK